MALPEADVLRQLLDVHGRLGAHGAEIEGLKLADRDTRLEVTRLGDRMDSVVGALRAELKQDIERLQAQQEKSKQEILEEIRKLPQFRAAEAAPRRTPATDFVAQHWKALGLAMAAIGFAIFGAGMKAGNEGVTPSRLIDSVVQ